MCPQVCKRLRTPDVGYFSHHEHFLQNIIELEERRVSTEGVNLYFLSLRYEDYKFELRFPSFVNSTGV